MPEKLMPAHSSTVSLPHTQPKMVPTRTLQELRRRQGQRYLSVLAPFSQANGADQQKSPSLRASELSQSDNHPNAKNRYDEGEENPAMQSYVLPEAHDPEESWTDEERAALAANLDEAYQQAVRGELIDGEQAFREIELMKEAWRKSKRKGFLRQPHQSAPPLV